MAAVLGLLICGAAAFVAYRLFGAMREPSVTSVVRPTVSVVASMRQLALLHAVTFHIERVIDLRDRQSHFFGTLESEDAILLVAAGDVNAGVNLAFLRDEDVRVDDARKSVQITLPAPQVLSATLDNGATYVHTRRTDTLARRQETLETRARQEAERTLRDAALAGGILQKARESSQRAVTSLLGALGFQHIQVRFRDE